MNPITVFPEFFARCPLVAILRGIDPDSAEAIGHALADVGFTLVEVPLNTPDALLSIERIADVLGGWALVGAGTVLTPAQVARVADAGGQLVVSPNTDPRVIAATVTAGMVSIPGCLTPTEAFAGLAAGAHALKFFPAEIIGPAGLRAQRTVLPPEVPLLAVGGVTPESLPAWKAAGASGLGLGSALYRPGMTAREVGANARRFLAAWETCG